MESTICRVGEGLATKHKPRQITKLFGHNPPAAGGGNKKVTKRQYRPKDIQAGREA
jgi:hypothetical protein